MLSIFDSSEVLQLIDSSTHRQQHGISNWFFEIGARKEFCCIASLPRQRNTISCLNYWLSNFIYYWMHSNFVLIRSFDHQLLHLPSTMIYQQRQPMSKRHSTSLLHDGNLSSQKSVYLTLSLQPHRWREHPKFTVLQDACLFQRKVTYVRTHYHCALYHT